MKRLFALIAVFGMLFFMASNVALAQDEQAATPEESTAGRYVC